METIRNYLDTMFANLPNTSSVLRAREELWQMMEDKYNELILEGKSENEALGTVISEFGNLSELAEAIGIEREVKLQNGAEEVARDNVGNETLNQNHLTNESINTGSINNSNNDSLTIDEIVKATGANNNINTIITVDDASEYIKDNSKAAFMRALGIALIILSPFCAICIDSILPLAFGSNFRRLADTLAPIGLMACIVAGILLIVFSANNMKKWQMVKKNEFALSMDAMKYVCAEKDRFNSNRSIFITVGVILCATCWMPAAILGELVHVRGIDELTGACLFFMVAVGVLLLVYQSQIWNGFGSLLKTVGKDTVKASYSPAKKEEYKYISTGAECVMSVYWPTILCLYLIISFVTMGWIWSWIIWPIAAIVCTILNKTLRVQVQND